MLVRLVSCDSCLKLWKGMQQPLSPTLLSFSGFAEKDAATRLPSGVDLYDKCITLCGLSKSWGLPGLRLGWVACKDQELLQQVIICNNQRWVYRTHFKKGVALCAVCGGGGVGAPEARLKTSPVRRTPAACLFCSHVGLYTCRGGCHTDTHIANSVAETGFALTACLPPHFFSLCCNFCCGQILALKDYTTICTPAPSEVGHDALHQRSMGTPCAAFG